MMNFAKEKSVLNLLKNSVVKNGKIHMPIPNTLKMRRIYDISEQEFSNITYPKNPHSYLSQQDIENVLTSMNCKFTFDVFFWKEEIDWCDFECKENYFIVNDEDGILQKH